MKKISSEVVEKFNRLHKEFHQSYNEESAKKLLNFFQDPETFVTARKCARNNPHPLTHQNFESDWEAVQISLKNWIGKKVDLSVPLKFLHDIKIWISLDSIFFND
ncbi:MAG: hypothetical protein ACRCSV_05870 [Chlamydiales bacterium]